MTPDDVSTDETLRNVRAFPCQTEKTNCFVFGRNPKGHVVLTTRGQDFQGATTSGWYFCDICLVATWPLKGCLLQELLDSRPTVYSSPPINVSHTQLRGVHPSSSKDRNNLVSQLVLQNSTTNVAFVNNQTTPTNNTLSFHKSGTPVELWVKKVFHKPQPCPKGE